MKTKYMVVHQCSSEYLKKEVEKKLADGWELQGGVSTSLNQCDGIHNRLEVGFLQALVKRNCTSSD